MKNSGIIRRCRHETPHFRWKAAVIPFESTCEIQGLIAETWKRQLKNYLVLAVNFGYIGGKVAYAVRTELDVSVIDFMESLKPARIIQKLRREASEMSVMARKTPPVPADTTPQQRACE